MIFVKILRSIVFLSFVYSLFLANVEVKAQTCPHSACGAPGLPCCAGSVVIQPATCVRSGSSCVHLFDPAESFDCDNSGGSSCQTNQGVPSSNDPCIQGPTDPYGNFSCSIGSSPGSCCTGGVVPGTSTPSPTGGGGGGPTNTPTPGTPSCTVSLNASYSVVDGNTITISPTVTDTNGTVSTVRFTVANTARATVCSSGTTPCSSGAGPYTDASSPFSTHLTGQSPGSTTLTALATMGGGQTCQDTTTISVNALPTATNTPTPTPPAGKSCTVSIIPATVTIAEDTSTSFSATVSSVVGGTVDSVIFRSLNTIIAHVCAPGNEPCLTSATRTDTTSPYSTSATGHVPGSVTIRAEVQISGTASVCTDTSTLTVSAPTPTPTSAPTPTPTPVPCRVTTNPASIGLSVGGSGLPVTASVTSGLGGASVTNMAFGSYNTSLATVSPANDATSIYQTTVSPVAAGSTAVWATATLSDGRTCPSTAATDTDVNVVAASCTITLSGTYSPAAGATVSVNPVTTVSGGTISQVAFTVGNSAIATVCANGTGPCPAGSGSYTDLVSAFNADLTGQSGGSTTLTAVATMNTGSTCTSNISTVNSTNATGWWQVISGDIIAGNAGGGSAQSIIPATCILASCNPVLIKNNTAGFSGVPSTGTTGGGSVNTGTGSVSTANWRATGAGFLSAEGYNYTYFERKIPSGVTPTVVSGPSVLPTVFESGGAEYPAGSGYFWYQYNNASDLNISGGDGSVDLAGRKVILFAEGANVILSTKVTLNDGLGAFYLFVERDITIASTVGDAAAAVSTPDIEGVLFAGDQIVMPSSGSSNDPQLHIRGAVVGLGTGGVSDGIDPNRVLSNNGLYPAEVFEFGPDLIMNWPRDLTRRTLQWREVAP